MEIARRVSLPDKRNGTYIKGTAEAAIYLRERLRGLPDENFRVLFLNKLNRLLDDVLIAEGTVGNVHPPIRKIVAKALQVMQVA